jgi:hypothetical protein
MMFPTCSLKVSQQPDILSLPEVEPITFIFGGVPKCFPQKQIDGPIKVAPCKQQNKTKKEKTFG